MEIVAVKRHYTTPEGGRIYGWEIISVFEALKLADPTLRCSECHGAVRLHRSTEETPAHADHRKRNPGCSLGEHFAGTKKMADLCIQ